MMLPFFENRRKKIKGITISTNAGTSINVKRVDAYGPPATNHPTRASVKSMSRNPKNISIYLPPKYL
jgi:hypothetical protein